MTTDEFDAMILHNNDAAPYVYRQGSDRDESRLCDQVSDGKSNRVMRKVLEEAAGIVCGDRQDAYGLPEVNHERTARLWSVFLGIPVTARQVCYCNILQKCGREVNFSKRDTDVDIAGYAANAAACHAAQMPVNGT